MSDAKANDQTRRTWLVIASFLGLVGLVTAVAVLWLQFDHGVRFLGPFPTMLLFIVPLHAGMLAFAWADRARHPGMFKVAVVTAILVVLISPLLFRWR